MGFQEIGKGYAALENRFAIQQLFHHLWHENYLDKLW